MESKLTLAFLRAKKTPLHDEQKVGPIIKDVLKIINGFSTMELNC